MPEICRGGIDKHIGHMSPTPNSFHQTPYVASQTKVFVGNPTGPAVRDGDATACGDPVAAFSSKVFIGPGAKGAHRAGDATGSHESWVANAAASGAGNVIAGG